MSEDELLENLLMIEAIIIEEENQYEMNIANSMDKEKCPYCKEIVIFETIPGEQWSRCPKCGGN